MAAIVYLATNTVNGKRYVGVTSHGLSRRRGQHENHAFRGKRIQCRYFHAAIRKFGPEAFQWTTLLVCETFEDGLREEIRLISEIRPEYNLTAGGQGTRGRIVSQEQRDRHRKLMTGRKFGPEHGERVRQANLGTKRTPEQRARISASRRGKPLSDEHRRNLSLSHRGHKQSPETVAKRTASRIGKPLTEGHRKNLSIALKGHRSRKWKKDPEAIRRGWETRCRNQEAANVSSR